LLQITHDLDLGGLQQVVYQLCRAIDRDRFDVSVLCLRERGRFAPDVEALGVPVHLLDQEPGGVDYFAFRKVARMLKALSIDAIHTHNTQPFIDGTMGAFLAGVHTIVHTDHARAFPDKTRYMVAEWAMSQLAYKVVACSEHTAQQLRRYEKISPAKLVTIPNGIDGSKFEVTIDRGAMCRELGITRTGPIIGLAVRLSEQKGITYLLQAMPAILQQHPDTTLIIAGEGELKEALQTEAAERGVAANVIFCGARKDIPQLVKLLDVYVLPSIWEGLPMVILEAMASGCPVVATDVGGTSTAVVQGETGELVKPADPALLALAIIKLLDSPQLRQQYAVRARALFASRFTAEAMTRQYERLYLRQ
jgi:glycosyltransferase involved in cell wall biosynthesis